MNAQSELLVDRVRGADRIASLDIVRGIAILFILIMNMPVMGGYEFILFDFRYPTWTTADYWATLFTRIFLEGTQRGLLELLFGAGIMIMARRAMMPDGPVEVADLHYRRNLWLCIFGLANAFVLLWFGDILLVYGLAAVFLFPFRKLGPKAQCGIGGLFLAALIMLNAMDYRQEVDRLQKVEQIVAAQASGKTLSEEDKTALKEHREKIERKTQLPADNAKAKEKIAKADKAHHSTFSAYWNAQFEGWTFIMGFFWYIEAEILSTMLIGMALFQWGVIQGRARSSVYWALLIAGYGIGIAIRGSFWVDALRYQPGLHWQGIVFDVARLAMSLGHLALIHLIVRSAIGYRMLKPFEAAGRMPLTVYLGTSLLMMWIVFAPWGLDLFGVWGHAEMLAVSVIVIGAELIAANFWLKYYENGPMEWLWKSLAYERREPFRKLRSEPADAAPSPA